jgi:putative ABC transport system permease protein
MFKNYLKSTLRFLRHNKVFAGINLLSLSIALAASFIMLLYVINELSYDHFHKYNKRVFRVLNYYHDFDKNYAETPYVLATGLKEEFPQIEKAIRVREMRGFRLKKNNEYINISNVIATDSEVFDIFSIQMILGSADQNLLQNLNSIVISRDLAKIFFPGQNPIGKEITAFTNNAETGFIVTGVFENIPENSSFKAKCFVNSKLTVDPINRALNSTDAEVSYYKDFWITWVRLSESCNVKLLENQFRNFEKTHLNYLPQNHYSLQNLKDVYLHSQAIINTGIQGNINNVKLFSVIGFLIVLVAAINYIILSTAVSTGRAKEIGLRKTYGADNRKIKYQLFSESVLMAIVVLPIAFILFRICIPYAGKLFQTDLHIIRSNIVIYIIVYITLTIFVGLASGIYTSGYLSRLSVINILKNSSQTGNRKQILRSFLIIIQLIIFCSFVSGTLIIYSQYKFAIKKDLGYYNSDILIVDLGRGFSAYPYFINNIKSNPNIIEASGVMESLPMEGSMNFVLPNFQNKEEMVKVEGLNVDYNFLKTMGITLLYGRDFSIDFGSDLSQAAIINEKAIKQLGINDPIGKKIEDHTIIGVVKDFNLHSIYTDIPPLEITMTDKYIMQAIIHYKKGTLNSILPIIETEWHKVSEGRSFRYSLIEDVILSLYSSEKNLTFIISIFAFFTLLIASSGLFGLTLFIGRARTKEIGIKKVFGSSEKLIVYSFLKWNLILVSLSGLLSIPITLHFMTNWLNNFAFKTNINWGTFLISYAIAATVVLLTVFVQSHKASRINPKEALRYE